MTTVVTENSTYFIDKKAHTWQRAANNGVRGNLPLRTTSGIFVELAGLEVGKRLYMQCPPIVPNTSARIIITSEIKSISETPCSTYLQ